MIIIPMSKGTDLLGEALQELIKEAQQELGKDTNGADGADRLLMAEEAAQTLAVSPDWLYRHANRLPFTRKLGPRMLRFSEQGIQKYLATRKSS